MSAALAETQRFDEVLAQDLVAIWQDRPPTLLELYLAPETRLPEIWQALQDNPSDEVWVKTASGWGRVSLSRLFLLWQEREKLRVQAEERNVQQALAALAHDIAGPIAVIQSTNSLFLSELLRPEALLQEGYATSIDENCRKALQLVDDVLLLEKVRMGKLLPERAPVDVAALLRNTGELFQGTAKARGVTLQLEFAGGVEVLADSQKLERVFYNLLSNAIKNTPRGKSVSLRLRNKPRSVYIDVVDEGAGITAEKQARLFEPFTLRSSSGHGLGLWVVKTLLESQGGGITLRSAPGEGSCFTVSLPRNLQE